MNKIVKSAAAFAAAAAIVGVSAAPAVIAWGDDKDGRKSYTIDQINEKNPFGNTPVFNSISNSVIGDEKNFVGARFDNGDHGKDNVWNGNDITVEDGKTYIIRLYVHNNNPGGEKSVAENVTTTFALPTVTGTDLQVNGFINSSNATPSEYWDYVNFHSSNGQAFYLDYIEGSALLENNGIGANGGIKLSDNIITSTGVKIGYKALDGKIPGCYQYASYVTIKVKAVYTDAPYIVEKTVRKVGEKTWSEWVEATTGEEVEYQIHYKNTTNETVDNVMVKDVLPNNMELVKGTTMLYNATNPKGIARDDTITTTGVNIGGYATKGDAYVRFRAKVVDNSMVCGTNQLVNWGQVGVGSTTLQDSASVMVKKTCQDNADTTTPAATDGKKNTPSALPTTGASSIVAGVLGAGSIVTAAGYYIASRKQLR